MQENTREMVLQSIILYEILLKRKLIIDQLAEGLESLGFRDLMVAFPDAFEPLFVAAVSGNSVTADQILEMITPPNSCSEDEHTSITKLHLQPE